MLNLRRNFLFGLAAATGVIASPLSAAILTPSSDGTIRGGGNANTVQGGGTATVVSVLPADNINFARKAYFQFDLSSFTGPITDAELAITFNFGNSDSNGLPINVYAINDGVTGEDTWDETTLTWNNAPSNVTSGSAADIASGVVASETTLLGSVSPTSGEIASGLTFVIDSAVLLSELQGDTNNAITFIVTGTGSVGSPVRPIIDSRENPTGSGVSLTLVPEPGSLALIAVGVGLTLTRRRVPSTR